MTALQIVLLSITGALTIASIVFMIMFIVEITVSSKEENKEVEVKSIFSSETYVKETTQVESVDSMLAKLDEQAQDTSSQEEIAEEKTEEIKEESVEEAESVEKSKVEESTEEQKDESEVVAVEETSGEEVAETKENAEETTEETAETKEEIEEETKSEVEGQPVVEEAEKAESKVEETENAEQTEPVVEETAEVVADDKEKVEVGSVTVEGEQITPANLLDYKARLEKVIENRDKLNKDLIKIEKSILNYERTKRRKIRNQKMLDRRASELTNLNLVMYSVTDIKNVDEEKKVKQEELTSHIAELKASIQDADEFLDSNKEKNEHDVKMAKFLIQEKARLKEEIAELEALIAKTEGNSTAV